MILIRPRLNIESTTRPLPPFVLAIPPPSAFIAQHLGLADKAPKKKHPDAGSGDRVLRLLPQSLSELTAAGQAALLLRSATHGTGAGGRDRPRLPLPLRLHLHSLCPERM